MKYKMKRHITKTLLYAVIILITVTIIADFIIDALTPNKSLAFTYRLIANICMVVIFGIIYWWKKNSEVEKKQ